MYYVVNKVIISPKIDNYKITVDNIFNSLLDVERYINSMTYIEVNSKTRILHPIESPIGTEIPTENDPDGYYIIKNTQKENRYDIYEKQTKLDKGYIYNSINQSIKKIMFYEINCFEKNLFSRKYIFRPNNITEHRTTNNSLTNWNIEKSNKINENKTNEIEANEIEANEIEINEIEVNENKETNQIEENEIANNEIANNEIENNKINTLNNKSLSYKITPTEINQIFVIELKQKIKEIQEQKFRELQERKNK